MPERSPEETSYLQRLLALKLIRENMFLDNPKKYSFTDIAEDLPGAARAVAPLVKNVLPSAAIISSDTEERKQQIRKAIDKIKNSGHSKSELGKEILNNIYNMGAGTLGAGLILSAGIHLLGFRSPIVAKKLRLKGKGLLQSPITPIANIKKLFSQPGYAAHLGKDSLKEALTGAGMAATAGTMYPLIAHNYRVPDKALEEAGSVIQENPYSTSLPASEMMGAFKDSDNSGVSNKLKNIGIGTGLGAATGVAGAFTPSAIKAIGYALKNLATRRPITEGMGQISRGLGRDIKNAVRFGGGLGAISGLLANRSNKNEYENSSQDKA